jgi:hypothetical protein
MLTVCVSASSTDGSLITTAYYRTILGATSTADDATQLSLVRAASAWASAYVAFPLLAQTYSESLPAYGTRDLLISGRPVRQVLRLLGSSSTDDATEYCSTDYSVDFDAGIFRARQGTWGETSYLHYHLGPFVPPRTEADTLYCEYTAGYVVGGLSTADTIYSTAGIGGSTSTGETLPFDIQLAVALKAVSMARAGQTLGIESKSIGDLSITYGAGAAGSSVVGVGITPESLLNQYRSA